MAKTYLLQGSWNVICDRCGHKYKADQLRREWTGLMTCQGCWEPRHPQDFLRSVPDNMSVPYVRPEGADIFVPRTLQQLLRDILSVEDQLSTVGTYIRYIPDFSAQQVLPPLERPLNGWVLNGRMLNAPDSFIPDTSETVSFTENLQITSTNNTSDTLTMQETMFFFLGTLIDETVTLTESISAIIPSAGSVLNGSAINSGALG